MIKKYESAISKTVARLSNPESFNIACHEHRLGEPLPSIAKLSRVIEIVREIIFPGFFGNTSLQPEINKHYMGVYLNELFEILNEQILAGLLFEKHGITKDELNGLSDKSKLLALDFIEYIPEIRRKMVTDLRATYLNDPAAKSFGEVIFCYPAIKAITNYRVAHKLLELEVPIIPRFISEMAHSETGIDIHPGAQIGESFTIDHGTGVVIGSTCILGNNVIIYQGVTLGAKSFPQDENGNPIKGIARHPIVEDDVVIYSGATILGRITIGKGSVIGGNVWVTNSLPPYSKIAQSKPRENSFADGAGI